MSRFGARLERGFLGMIMAILAFFVERRVNKALKRGGAAGRH